MFSARNLIFLALSVVLLGQATAAPMPMPMLHARKQALQRREAAPFDTIPAYVKRADVNTFPVQQASMAPDGIIVPYTATTQAKRQVNTMPEQVATKSDENGNIVPYNKRAGDAVNTMPEQVATKSDGNGNIVPYNKREVNTVPEELPTKSDSNGQIVPYKRADINTLPAELPVAAPAGVIVPFSSTVGKRQVNTMPEQVATKSDENGNIVPYNKRASGAVNTMPEQVATKSDGNGNIVPYNKRAGGSVNTFPAEQPSTAPNGVIEPFIGGNKGKREVNTVPEELPTKSDSNGQIVPYKREDINTFPAQQASMSPDGIIVAYSANEKSQN